MIPLVDLTAQHDSIREELDTAIARVVSSGRYVLGEEVEAFEYEVATYLGVKYAVGVASGTDALYLALRAIGIGLHDRVVTTPFTFVATAEAIVRCSATPVFVDVNESGNLSTGVVCAYCIENTVDAIIPVHLYGNPVRVDELPKVPIIEDSAQAAGMVHRGGTIACFSFFPSKILGCMGDGGLIATDNEHIAKIAKRLRNHGNSGGYVYLEHGINSRLDELQAAILRVKLKYLDQWTDARRRLAALYDTLLPQQVELLSRQENSVCNYYTIKVEDRDNLRRHLSDRGIATAVYYPLPLHLQPVYTHLGYRIGDFPMAEELAGTVLSLPLYPELSEETVIIVVDAIREYYDRQ